MARRAPVESAIRSQYPELRIRSTGLVAPLRSRGSAAKVPVETSRAQFPPARGAMDSCRQSDLPHHLPPGTVGVLPNPLPSSSASRS